MDLLGYTPLRNKIKRYLESKFELAFSPNQLLDWWRSASNLLILQTILSAGEGIAVESPSFTDYLFQSFRNAFIWDTDG